MSDRTIPRSIHNFTIIIVAYNNNSDKQAWQNSQFQVSIYCLKPGGVAHSALETMTSLHSSFQLEEEDYFADCDTELEEDETLIDGK